MPLFRTINKKKPVISRRKICRSKEQPILQ
jgi:hypothetical protein